MVKLYSSQLLVLNEIKAVKEGYIFDALEEDWKQHIDNTLKLVSKINDIKNTLDNIASNAMCEVINKYIKNTNYEEEVGNIEFNMKGSNLYDVLINHNLYFLLVHSNYKPEIFCEIWVEHIIDYPEAGKIPVKSPEYQLPIEEVFKRYMNIELDFNNELPESDINNIEEQIIRTINDNTKHILMENEYKELIKNFNTLQNEINERIKYLIIPGHKKKKTNFIKWQIKNKN
ncbi:hypothetical protein [Bacillus mycoides]|uniref:hypothetical protein n=1 Tax=Bacillus mycoides TaxID=1405 RepID=UPI001F1752A9|nr:hypothetical protein [Bacillus mycoides]